MTTDRRQFFGPKEANMRRRFILMLVATAAIAAGVAMQAPAVQAAPTAQAAPAAVSAIADTAAATATYYKSHCGNTSGRELITVDDWSYGDPYRATRIGAYLQSQHIKAAFFLINKYAKQYPDIVKTLRAQGHWVLNHTYSHPNLTTLSDYNVGWQIRNGVVSNRLRPPGGAYNTRVSNIAAGLGYRICTWTIDTRDWQYVNGARRSVASIRTIVRTSPASAKSSGVILGHLFTNFEFALPGIIYDLHHQGYLFCLNRGPVGANVTFPLACT